MRNLIVVVGVSVIGLGGAACAYNPPPVPVYASRADWEILAGHWQGTYTTSSSGRRGVIEFTLSAGDEQAFGDVLMFGDAERAPYRQYPSGNPRLGPTNEPYAQLLTIRFVRAERGLISGTIASYWDPDRRCQALATFLGETKPREIDGTFTSICEDGLRQLRGKWRVTRQAGSAH